MFSKIVISVILALSFVGMAYAGSVSSKSSVVFPSEQVVKNINGFAFVNVKLVDDKGLPVSGHEMRLIPSVAGTSVSFYSSNTTNSKGEIIFRVSSSTKGPVTYSIYDVTADKILDAKAKVLYFNDSQYIFNNNYSGATTFLASGNSSSVIDGFKFENLPASIVAGKSVTFTVSAKDSMGDVVTSYDGQIRFSVVSGNASNAILPSDYTFTVQDQGSHTFSLATTFQVPGNYTVEVRDMKNFALVGSQDFKVLASVSGGSSNSGAFNISNPVAGTYSNNTQVISGKAVPGAKLDLFDGQLKLTSLIADVTGNYSYTVSGLSDGDHNFRVVEVDSFGTVVRETATVLVKIDTSAPTLNKVEIMPSNPSPGTTVKVKLYTTESLLQAAALFQSNIYQMSDSGNGYYEADFAVPLTDGNYPVDFILVDQLGNETRLDSKANVPVGTVNSDGTVAEVGNVSELKAQASDHRISLTWKAPSIAGSGIQNYRIYYGVSPSKLTEAIDTFTASTTWYIPNLKNDTKYYLGVAAVDKKGNISPSLSNIVEATPSALVANVPSPDVQGGIAGNDSLIDPNNSVSDTGPEMAWLVFIAFIGASFYSSTFRRRVEIRERS